MFQYFRTEQQGGGDLPVSFGRIGGGATMSSPTRGFLSLMRTVTALLGYAVMASTSRRATATSARTIPPSEVVFS